MSLIFIIVVFIVVIVAALVKIAKKAELSGKLGREAQDHELVSLNSWIEAERKEDARKGIKSEIPPVQKSVQINDKKEFSEQKAATTNKEVSEKELKTPNNCPKCGAVLSKEIAYCQFCGSYSNRKALEEHTSIFLHDLDKDFEQIIPGSHEHLRFGCFLIPLLALIGAVAVYFFLPPMRYIGALIIGLPIISLIVAYIWINAVDSILTKKEGVIFDQKLEPRIRQFMKGNNLQDLELLNIAKRNLSENNKLLKHIHRRF